jgi:site-specific recombinase XerD
MAIEAKATLLSGLEQQLSSTITASDMAAVLSAVADQLEAYDVKQIDADDHTADDLLDAYTAALRIGGRSEKTIARYRYLIGRMMQAVKVPTRSITVYHLRQYLAQEKQRGLSDRSLEGIRQVFNTYFNWLHRERLIDVNPVANLGAIKWPKKIKIIYSEVDIERMKFCCKSIRDRAIVGFLLSTGCRISEVMRLNRDDVDLVNLECKVFGKGAKERTVYFDAVTGMLLREYLAQRCDNLPALFVGQRSCRLTSDGVRHILKGLQARAHVEKVHPHKFRRTLATNLIRHGMPIQDVAAILGHDKLETTMEYVVLDQTEVKNNYRKYA